MRHVWLTHLDVSDLYFIHLVCKNLNLCYLSLFDLLFYYGSYATETMLLHTIYECCVVTVPHLKAHFKSEGDFKTNSWGLSVFLFNSFSCHPTAVSSEEPTISGSVKEPEPVCVARGWRGLEEC